MAEIIQGSLFEEDYLVRTVGSLAWIAETALTELVANAWDAGATRVDIQIPSHTFDEISVVDNGTGLTADEFRKRWMTLGYNRLKHQGEIVQFPSDVQTAYRWAYGRNGIGRHGMLCFADEYVIETSKDGYCNMFVVQTSKERQPFTVTSHEVRQSNEHGTKLTAQIHRNLPNADTIREVISARFLHDPQFQVYVNGESIELTNHKGIIEETVLVVEEVELGIYTIDSTKAAKTARQHGVAFWVGNRLVGKPGWHIGDVVLADGRTNFAKRHTIVVKCDGLYNEVLPDWSGFKPSKLMDSVLRVLASYVDGFYRMAMKDKIGETTREVLTEHRSALRELSAAGRFEVSEFVQRMVDSHPIIQAEMLSIAVDAVIHLEKTRSGASLLQKLSALSEEDVDGLNRLLEDWDVKDALSVLDEIDKRLLTLEALERLSIDPSTDELKTLHPLVLQSRWLFGPEFDSPMFTSNVSLTTAVQELFGERPLPSAFYNARRRPDIIVMERGTITAVCTEESDADGGLSVMGRILLVELKRGGFTIGRDEINQANNYVEDLLNSGHLDGSPFINAFVVGYKVDSRSNNSRIRKIGDHPERGRVEITTYNQLVRTAHQRLFRLKSQLSERYQSIGKDTLVHKLLEEPQQLTLLDDTDIETA
ncbi:ATP-binding protein [Alicyclobacillus sp. ALC3]|uniref:ATP-binding protein n=1 Tax=Alicyclobacillus sp. ALC3 TaxID=2796143 RepID=UPI00237968CF|nr:ATP-binding protein [Alicyclobacillus sp. ALC3]WDL98479.1 ATP-binding protein [Alicyclobacillus sp. ALC3]